MTVGKQIQNELKKAGYKFVRRGEHFIYRNDALKHTITIPTTTHDNNAVRITRGLIRHGKRLSKIH